MSIREPSSATWKRPDGLRRAGFAAACAMAALLAGCLVTDTIEFEDAINGPLEVVSASPAESLLRVCRDERRTFAVTVWDPDEDDAEQPALRARLTVDIDEDVSVAGECKVPTVGAPPAGQGDPEMGAFLDVACTVNLGILSVSDGDLLTARIELSDIGFGSADTIKEGAHGAVVTWVLEVGPPCD